MIKILNLYAGIGGNRKLWPNDEIEVTAVEINPEIAKIYGDFFPQDKMVVGDAHQYLLDHYKEYDFIWASPPCQTHTRFRLLCAEQSEDRFYPDMRLYQEVIFLQYWFKGKWVIENVVSYYKPLIYPFKYGGHYYWANFIIPDNMKKRIKIRNDKDWVLDTKMVDKGIVVKDWFGYGGDKRQIINNCVEPVSGLAIFNLAFKEKQVTFKSEEAKGCSFPTGNLGKNTIEQPKAARRN